MISQEFDRSRAESLVEISNWIVGCSQMVQSHFDNPGVCTHIQIDVTALSKT